MLGMKQCALLQNALAERYLGGSVGFHSTEAEGTVFFLRLPKEAPAAQGSPASVSGQPRPQTFQE